MSQVWRGALLWSATQILHSYTPKEGNRLTLSSFNPPALVKVKMYPDLGYSHGTFHFVQSLSLNVKCASQRLKSTSHSGCLIEAEQHLTSGTLFSYRLPPSTCKEPESCGVTSEISPSMLSEWSARTHLVGADGRMGSGSLFGAAGGSVAEGFSE